MPKKNVSLIRGMYDALAEGDLPKVLEGLHPEIEWNEAEHFPYADGNPYVGPAAVAEGVLKRLGDEWSYWKLALDDLHDAGDTVIALGRYQAEYKKNGATINAQFAHVWRVHDGKAVQFQQYTDTEQITRAMAGA